jgi:hypothetical protein
MGEVSEIGPLRHGLGPSDGDAMERSPSARCERPTHTPNCSTSMAGCALSSDGGSHGRRSTVDRCDCFIRPRSFGLVCSLTAPTRPRAGLHLLPLLPQAARGLDPAL